MLKLKMLNSDATLNDFRDIGYLTFISGETLSVVMRIEQKAKNYIRYIPDAAATITIDLLKSDKTTITKTASFPFADDRSIIKFEISDSESPDIIGQDLKVKIVEGANISYAVLEKGIQRILDC